MSEENTMNIWSNIYFTALVIAALAGVISIISGYIQHKLDEKLIRKMQANIAVANDSAAQSNERAANAELRSRELEIQLKKLRLAVADRFIPQFVTDALVPELQKYTNKSVIILVSVSSSHEPRVFSQDLHLLFQTSGWNSNLVNEQSVRVPPPRGIDIFATGEANKEIAEFIHNQFEQLGYLASVEVQETGQFDITIQVFAK